MWLRWWSSCLVCTESWACFPVSNKLCVVASNLSTWARKTGWSEVQGLPHPHSEFKVRLQKKKISIKTNKYNGRFNIDSFNHLNYFIENAMRHLTIFLFIYFRNRFRDDTAEGDGTGCRGVPRVAHVVRHALHALQGFLCLLLLCCCDHVFIRLPGFLGELH